jgi:putative heme iron utilization protein
MDADAQLLLATILRSQRVAAFGTLRGGAPFVSLIAFSTSDDLASFYIHASKLAYHTQDILNDPRCSLMIAETDHNGRDPQTLARVTVRGEATLFPPEAPDYDEIRTHYLKKFPEAAFLFELEDFAIYRIAPTSGRFVAGFARTFNLTLQDLKRASGAKV